MLALRAAAVAAALFAGLQFTGPDRPPNQPLQADQALAAHVQIPAHIDQLLHKGCVNCHTNQTHWPWYARFAPVSWLVNQDVAKGRAVFNMSEWGNRYKTKPALAATLLVSGCSSLKSGRMPIPQYLLMHPEAKLSPAEINQYCDWAKTEARALLRKPRAN